MARIEAKAPAAAVITPKVIRPTVPWYQHGTVRTIIYHGLVGIAALIMLYPIMWLVGSSFKPPDEIWTNQTAIIPNEFYPQNYPNGWAGFGGISFTTFYRNSLFYATFGTLLSVSASTVVAYGFARVRFTGRRIWFAVMLVTLHAADASTDHPAIYRLQAIRLVEYLLSAAAAANWRIGVFHLHDHPIHPQHPGRFGRSRYD